MKRNEIDRLTELNKELQEKMELVQKECDEAKQKYEKLYNDGKNKFMSILNTEIRQASLKKVNETLTQQVYKLDFQISQLNKDIDKAKKERDEARVEAFNAKASMEIFKNDNEGLLFVQKMMQLKFKEMQEKLEEQGSDSTAVYIELAAVKKEYHDFRQENLEAY